MAIHLLESAPHNVGQNKVYRGVAANLFAFACARSFALKFEGYVAFEAKSALIEHYKASPGSRTGWFQQPNDHRDRERIAPDAALLQGVRPMAVVIDIEDIDLVVEPHKYTDEDREALRSAVQQHRQSSLDTRVLDEAARILARHRQHRSEQA
jgi:hypothetical protein